ncbi:MAG: hypothetical protein KDK70_28300 [Myxococcales bacterium]|nr:hypothetical protein [Myxococcales bacterium]
MRLLGLSLGLLLGLGACDDDPPPPPPTTCPDWLVCYTGCRATQFANDEDRTLTAAERHTLCVAECVELRSEVEEFPPSLDLSLREPQDNSLFWQRLQACAEQQ